MSTCRCGAALVADASWCPICLRRVVDQEELLAELHDTFRKTTWSPPAHLVAPAPPKRFTRWRATLFTFGPRVKVSLTIPVAAFMTYSIWIAKPWHLFRYSGRGEYVKPFIVFQLVMVLSLGALFLRVLWQKAREE